MAKAKKESGNKAMLDWLADKVGAVNIVHAADQVAVHGSADHDALVADLTLLTDGAHRGTGKRVVSVERLRVFFG